MNPNNRGESDMRDALNKLTVRVAQLETTQEGNHKENRTDIGNLKADINSLKVTMNGDGTNANPGINMKVDRVENYLKAIKEDVLPAMIAVLKVVAWIIGVGLVGAGVYIASLEYRHRIGDNAPAQHTQNVPENAHLPNLK